MINPYTMVTDARHIAAKGEVVVMSKAAFDSIRSVGYAVRATRFSHDQFDVIRLTEPVFDNLAVAAVAAAKRADGSGTLLAEKEETMSPARYKT